MKSRYQNQKGFSIIELIIVISIIVVFVGVGTQVYKNIMYERRLSIDVRLVTSIIEETKQKARARDVSPLASCLNFVSYNIIVDPRNGTLTQQFMCDATTIDLASYTLTNTTMTSPRSARTLHFTYPLGNHADPALTITLKNAKTSTCADISIPQVTASVESDPYNCP